MFEQCRHGKPVGQRTDHPGLGRGTHESNPCRRSTGLSPSAAEEHRGSPDQEAQRDDFHPAQLSAAFGVRLRVYRERSTQRRAGRASGPVSSLPFPVLCHSTIIQVISHAATRRVDGLKRAVGSGGTREREFEIVADEIPPAVVKTDGRKRRWHQHKVERRTELVDGTLEAIRRRGRYVSMDEIAADIGVSKTVLYRYFVDKNDLTTAVMMRFAQTTLIPNMAQALSAHLDGFELTREIIRQYVETVAAEPEIYPFVMANSSASKSKVIADSERIIAGMLAVMLRRRMQEAGMDTHGVQPWAYLIVGGVQLATHSWMSHQRMSSDELIDYLTMLSWSALCGIVEVGGSREKFNSAPHPSPILPALEPVE
jgi:AcrR family transcriptional regulator